MRPGGSWARRLPEAQPTARLSYVSVGKSHHLSEPQSLTCKMGLECLQCMRGGGLDEITHAQRGDACSWCSIKTHL